MLDQLPQPGTRNIAMHITHAAENVIATGHPWLFDQSITQQSFEGAPGDLAVIFDRKDRFFAIGLYDPDSPIRVRVLHQGDPVTINAAWFAQRVQAAVAHRQPLSKTQTTGYRLIHGENDGLPGLIVDRYDQTLVMKLYTAAWLPRLRPLIAALQTAQPHERLVLRLSRQLQAAETYGLSDGQILYGDALEAPVIFEENGLRFAADVISGHKTGFFFDQRENRAFVGKLARGRRVLDVFAYVGAFSLYAARGGAQSVLSVDASEPALRAAQQNFALNAEHTGQTQHDVRVGDAFDVLGELAVTGEKFDMVIVDPPSFAKRQHEIDGALAAYTRLTQRALDVLGGAGVLVMASCSSRVSSEAFFAAVHRAAEDAGRPLLEQRRTDHALDHPIGFDEGAYLKCLFATTID